MCVCVCVCVCICDESQDISRKDYHFPKNEVYVMAKRKKNTFKIIIIIIMIIIIVYQFNKGRVLQENLRIVFFFNIRVVTLQFMISIVTLPVLPLPSQIWIQCSERPVSHLLCSLRTKFLLSLPFPPCVPAAGRLRQ